VIAGEHPLMRLSLEAEPGIAIVGEAGDGEAALEAIARMHPDLAVLDVSLPGIDGFGVARELQLRRFNVGIVFVTEESGQATLDAALDLGVRGYVLKESAAGDIVAAVRAVAAGQYYISPVLTGRLMRGKQESDSRHTARLKALTTTEMRILRLIAADKTTREIAEALFVSPLTVETHRRNICEKLGLRGSNALGP
jgi:DNA-binding NarL/FixJ family response regulator